MHIHHYSYGILLMAVAGFLALIDFRHVRTIGFVYGVSLFMVADEFNMWVRLKEQGDDPLRHIGNLVVAAILVLILIVKLIKRRN